MSMAFRIFSFGRAKLAITSSRPSRKLAVGPRNPEIELASVLRFLNKKTSSPLHLVKVCEASCAKIFGPSFPESS